MAIRVAINGFGRIGRLAFRQLYAAEGFEVVAINDLGSPEMLAYLLKYDSSQKKFDDYDKVSHDDSHIIVGDKKIPVYSCRDAADCPWGELDVFAVIESTGLYTSKDKAMAHINAGAKKVIISAPGGKEMPCIVYNVNHETLTADDQIISAASCTTNCLAPMAKALNELAPIRCGIMTTIHAYTSDQELLDKQHKDNFRRSRAAAINIVPTTTGAAKGIGFVVPELFGKLIGSAQRVPVATGSSTILTAVVEGEVTPEQINEHMKKCANESFQYNDEMIVSSDIIGSTAASIFDSTQTMCNSIGDGLTEVQVVSWYDNESSYTYQMIRTIKYFTQL